MLCSFLLCACGSGGESTPSPEPKSATDRAAQDGKSPAAQEVSGNEEQAPERFTVKLATTKGDILIDVTRSWAPRGADRFYALVRAGYYDDVAFFRVIRGFMAQVGISGKPAHNAKWRAMRIQDDPVTQSNTTGMVTFATGGANTRTTQIFINFGNNARLDRMGFAPFGKVRDMTVVEALYAEYGEGAPRGKGPNQGRLQREGNPYLKSHFPEMDYIKTATVIE
ncbi:MAG: peptidylprolyl isomerase [Proteobacteria bacterium]|nr:peptidylprolyl isomerase [Pseudomonadota bacterium]